MIRKTVFAAAFAAAVSTPVFAEDIVEIAQRTDAFSTLVTAVSTAGLVETLKGDGPFTVFAPTDDAFAALPEGTVESLLMEENRDQLVEILTLHVVSGRVMSGDITADMSVEAVSGGTLNIDTDDGVTVNGANVIQADVEAENGVIHVIDSVILPQ